MSSHSLNQKETSWGPQSEGAIPGSLTRPISNGSIKRGSNNTDIKPLLWMRKALHMSVVREGRDPRKPHLLSRSAPRYCQFPPHSADTLNAVRGSYCDIHTSCPHICANSSFSFSSTCMDEKTSWRSCGECADTEGGRKTRGKTIKRKNIRGSPVIPSRFSVLGHSVSSFC
jgi:hypothetical protein